jgi:hypothetical protein
MVEARCIDEDDATALVTGIDGRYTRDILCAREYPMTDESDDVIRCCVDKLA